MTAVLPERLSVLSLYYEPATHYGGALASCVRLCEELARRGVDVRVLTTDADGPRRLSVGRGWVPRRERLHVRYCRRLGGGLTAPSMASELPSLVAWGDALYVWGMMNWALAAAIPLARARSRAVVISPRGMLLPEAMASKAAKKRAFVALVRALGGRAIRFHATSAPEASSVEQHFPGAAAAIVPNGVDVPAGAPPLAAPPLAEDGPYLLYLGRIHPHKRLDRLVAAFAAGAPPAMRLVLAGSGEEADERAVRALVASRGLGERVRFTGHVAGEEKARLLAHATALVLASRSENFGMSVAEALAHGTPCVVTRTAPWEGLERERCGMWVADDDGEVARAIGRIAALPLEERRAMGARGRAWMERDFSWAEAARRVAELCAAPDGALLRARAELPPAVGVESR